MPRPTAAQLAYGSATVVFSTLAMLLLSRTSSGVGIAVIGTAALALGLLVAVTVPLPLRTKTRKAARTATGVRTNPAVAHRHFRHVYGGRRHRRHPPGQDPGRPRAPSACGEHSLRR